MDFSRRIDATEIMDSEPLADGEMRRTLRFLERTNRYLGGDSLVFSYLDAWSRHWPGGRPVSVLDVGTGGADLPVRLVRWARRRGFDLRVTGIDSTPSIARIARESTRAYPEIEIVEADLRSFASSSRRFDVVIASLVLHHIPDDSLIDALCLLDKLAEQAALLSDLRRSQAGYWATSALTGLLGNRVVRHDGPLSIRRAFTVAELQGLAERAGLPYLRARAHAFFRLALAGEKTV